MKKCSRDQRRIWRFEDHSKYQNKGGRVVLGKVRACKGGCFLLGVGAGKLWHCSFLPVGASKT